MSVVNRYLARLDQLPLMLSYVRGLALRLGFKETLLMHLELAVEEALVNVIRHGYPASSVGEGVDDLELCRFPYRDSLGQRGIVVMVRDRGIAYDPSVLRVTSSTPREGREGGYGLDYMHRLLDEIHYRREEGSNLLTLIKVIPLSCHGEGVS